MELVDRQRLLAEAQKLNSVITGRDKPIPVAEAFMSVIEKQPTVEPRAKGEWVYGEDDNGIDGYFCDWCGFFVPWARSYVSIDFIRDYYLCPSCGTDMRGEKDG